MSIIDLLFFIFVSFSIIGFTLISVLEEFLRVDRKKLKLVYYKKKLLKYKVSSKIYNRFQSKIKDLEYELELFDMYGVK